MKEQSWEPDRKTGDGTRSKSGSNGDEEAGSWRWGGWKGKNMMQRVLSRNNQFASSVCLSVCFSSLCQSARKSGNEWVAVQLIPARSYETANVGENLVDVTAKYEKWRSCFLLVLIMCLRKKKKGPWREHKWEKKEICEKVPFFFCFLFLMRRMEKGTFREQVITKTRDNVKNEALFCFSYEKDEKGSLQRTRKSENKEKSKRKRNDVLF